MNKTVFKFLFPILFALFAFSSNAKALTSSDTVSFLAFIQFTVPSTGTVAPTVINENYAEKVLNYNFFAAGGSITADTTTVINSVNVEYVYNSTQPVFSSIISSAGFSNPENGVSTYSAIVGGVSLDSGTVFYRIAVDASDGQTYSPWYVLYNPKIIHRQIMRISEFDRILVATGTFIDNAKASHGQNASLTLEYYLDSDSSSILTQNIRLNGNSFIMNTDNPAPILNIPQGVQTVSYRIAATYSADAIKYNTHTGDWTTAVLNSSAAAVIDKDAGGMVVLQNADQRYGDAFIYVSPNILQNDTQFIFSECNPAGAYQWSSSENILKAYEVNTPSDANFSITLFGDGKNANYDIKYWNDISRLFEDLKTTKQNNGTYSSQGHSEGYYVLIMANGSAVVSNRPVKRAFMPGGKVKFNNLKDGDSVAIYNLKGKLIKKLLNVQPDGTIEWDGRNGNGNYVESASYVYQIRVKGKIISGTIAFVR